MLKTMQQFLILFGLMGLAAAASVITGPKSSQDAAILKESRYLNTDGHFGASYSQEDGVEFHEEADAEGNRKGSYTYIDPNGQRKSVTYTAGKDGFQAYGDHFPVAPSAPVNPFAGQTITQIDVNPSYPLSPFQSIPVPGLEQLFPTPVVVSTTEIPTILRHYPPGKLNVKHTADGFSYTFNSII